MEPAVKDTLARLRQLFKKCFQFFQEGEPGNLVLSTGKSEVLKGTITINGTCIEKGEIQVRFEKQPPLKIAFKPNCVLSQLIAAKNFMETALSLVNRKTSLDRYDAMDLLGEVLDCVVRTKVILGGGSDQMFLDPSCLSPAPPSSIILDAHIQTPTFSLTVLQLDRSPPPGVPIHSGFVDLSPASGGHFALASHTHSRQRWLSNKADKEHQKQLLVRLPPEPNGSGTSADTHPGGAGGGGGGGGGHPGSSSTKGGGWAHFVISQQACVESSVPGLLKIEALLIYAEDMVRSTIDLL